MESRELRDIIIAAAVLAIAFSFNWDINVFAKNLLPAAIGVSLGFILHELAHRFLAKKYKCYAEFRLWTQGLILALGLAILTNGSFIFAAPGAVYIQNASDLWGRPVTISKKQNGLISLIGPITNIILASIFLAIAFFTGIASQIMFFAASVNIWLAIFNMLPVPPLDGSKVFWWDKRIWIVCFAVFAALLFIFV